MYFNVINCTWGPGSPWIPIPGYPASPFSPGIPKNNGTNYWKFV